MLPSRLLTEDIPQIHTLQPPNWPDITREYVFYHSTPWCHPHKIMDGAALVAIGAGIHFGRTSWIGQLVVHENYRRRGLGSIIMDKILATLFEHGAECCSLIATAEGLPLYKHLGFHALGEYLFFQRQTPWNAQSVDHHITPLQARHLAAIFEMDKRAAGEDRSAFVAHFTEGGYCYIKDDILHGFYLPLCRDGLIVAETKEAGLALMALKYATIDKAVLPEENSVGVEFLNAHGFVATGRMGTRMYIGKNPPDWQPTMIFGRIGGNLG